MSSLIEKPLYLEPRAVSTDVRVEGVSTTNMMSAVRRHLLAVLLVLLLIPLCTAVVVSLIPSRYAATATVQVQTGTRNLHDIQAVTYDQNAIDPAVLTTTQIDILRSNGLALSVVRALHLDQNPEFVGPPEGLERIVVWLGNLKDQLIGAQKGAPSPEGVAMRSLLDLLTIDNEQNSDVIGITVSTHSRSLSVQVANTYADQYLKLLRRLKADETLSASDMLVDHLLDLKKQQVAAEQAAANYRELHGLTVVTGEATNGNSGPTVVGQQLAELDRQLVIASTARTQAEANLQQVRVLVAAGRADQAPQVLASPVVQHLRELEVNLSAQKAALGVHLIKGSPLLERINAEIAAVHRQIHDEVNKVVASLTTEVNAAQAREDFLNNQLRALRSQLNNQGKDMVRLRELDEEASAAGAIYQDLLQQHKQMTSGAYLQLADAVLVSAAVPPLHATSPKRTLIVLGSLAVACVIGVLLALRLERNHVGFRSAEEFAAEMGIPALGLLPRLPRRACKRFDDSLQPAVYREVVKIISARLLTPDFNGHGRAMMVTSAVPAEGKTWLSISLAHALAQLGMRILLIDCDLRRGSIARALGLTGHGLTDLHRLERNTRSAKPTFNTEAAASSGLDYPPALPLLDSLRRHGIVHRISPNLEVIPVFPKRRSSTEFLVSLRFSELLEQAKQTYDVVLVDTPPVMMVADGLLVARTVDSVLLAAQWGRTPRPMTGTAIRLLGQSGAYVAGAVLTMVDMRKYAAGQLGDDAYLYRRYSSYYGAPL
jgi:polysaccharide biosynthesis transport protein